MKNLYLSIVFGILFVCSLAYIGVITVEHEDRVDSSIALGAAFTPVQGTQYYLSGSGITSTQNTIQLTSFLTPDGRPLIMSMFGSIGYASIEPGTSKLEDVTFSGITQNTNGTAILTGVTRGNDFVSPYAASSTLAKAHAGGATFILSNTAGFYGGQFLFANNAATSSAVLVFGSTTPPQYDADPIWGNFSTKILADVSYVNSVVAGGAANASETVKGIVQLATGAQAASSTSLGSTAARLAIGANLATDTPNTATRGSKVLMSNMGGFLNQNWLDLTAPFTTSGAWTFANAVSIAASNSFKLTLNTVAYVFPSSQGTAGSRLQNDGSGNLSWVTGTLNKYTLAYSGSITANNSTATTSNMVVPANVLTASSTISFIGSAIDSASASCTYNIRDSLGNTYFSFNTATVPSGNTWQTTFQGLIWLYAANSSSGFGTFQSLTGGTVNAIQAGQNGIGNGSATTNLSTGVTFVGVVQANNGANCQFSNLVMTINP